MLHFTPDTEPAIHGEGPAEEGGDPHPVCLPGTDIGHAEVIEATLPAATSGVDGPEDEHPPEGADRGDLETHANVAQEEVGVQARRGAQRGPRDAVDGRGPFQHRPGRRGLVTGWQRGVSALHGAAPVDQALAVDAGDVSAQHLVQAQQEDAHHGVEQQRGQHVVGIDVLRGTQLPVAGGRRVGQQVVEPVEGVLGRVDGVVVVRVVRRSVAQ